MIANDGLMEIGGLHDADGKGMTCSALFSKFAKDRKGGLSYYDYNMDGWRGRKIKVT